MQYHQRKGLRSLVVGTSPFNAAVAEEFSHSGIMDPKHIVIAEDAARIPSSDLLKADVVFACAYDSADETAELRRILDHLRAAREGGKAPQKETIVTLAAGTRAAANIRPSLPYGIRLVDAEDLFVRIIAQSARQEGLAKVYRELLSFRGNDFYFLDGSRLEGLTFSRALRAFANACPVGLNQDGATTLNPSMDTVIKQGASLVILAHSLAEVSMNPAIIPAPDETSLANEELPSVRQESYLFLGWNPLCPAILAEIDQYAHPDSRVGLSREALPDAQSLPSFKNLSIDLLEGLATDQAFIKGIQWEYWENVILPGTAEPGDASAVELLPSVLAALDARGFLNNVTAVSWKSGADKTVDDLAGVLPISLVFRILAQIAANPALEGVVYEVTAPVGAEIYLKPAENYVTLDKPCDFYTILESAKRKGETAIGYMKNRDRIPVINPPKASKERFDPFDRIVVLSDEN